MGSRLLAWLSPVRGSPAIAHRPSCTKPEKRGCFCGLSTAWIRPFAQNALMDGELVALSTDSCCCQAGGEESQVPYMNSLCLYLTDLTYDIRARLTLPPSCESTHAL
eukprot:1660522-Pleurochrysis_carterae.AAC.2